MSNIVGEDDVLMSVLQHIKEGVVEVKDLSGDTQFLKGAFKTVFPDVEVYLKRYKDMEEPPAAYVEVDVYTRGHQSEYFSATEFYWMVTLQVLTGKLDPNGKLDHDQSNAYKFQLATALRQLFDEGQCFTLYSYTYDGEKATDNGVLSCTDFRTTYPDEMYTIDCVAMISGRVIGR